MELKYRITLKKYSLKMPRLQVYIFTEAPEDTNQRHIRSYMAPFLVNKLLPAMDQGRT